VVTVSGSGLSYDATLTSAPLNRLLHHGETVVIEGKSDRMKEIIETWPSRVAVSKISCNTPFFGPTLLNRQF